MSIVSPRQFQGGKWDAADLDYRYVERGPDDKVVLASHPQEGVVGVLDVQRLKENRGWGGGLSTTLAYVRPDFRRRGVASTLYGISSHMLGYQPQHDPLRTSAGNGWVKAVGGPVPQEHYKMPKWDIDIDEARESVNERQAANWERGQPIARDVVKAIAPYTPPRQRKRPQPEQLAFEGSEGWGR